jgi:Mg2+ and Co2+ transporter CorA
MIIDCAHYQDGRRRDEGAVPLEEAAARCGQGGFVWLGLFEPSGEELAQVRDALGLHELAVEDAQNFHMRPKVELYHQDVRLVILRTARYDDAAEEVEFGEISVFVAPTFVITVRQGVASELRGARQRLEQRPELLAAGSSAALWAILDQLTILATVFLPLTFVTGFFGQNFSWLVGHMAGPVDFVIYGIGGLVLPLTLLFLWLRLRTVQTSAAPVHDN